MLQHVAGKYAPDQSVVLETHYHLFVSVITVKSLIQYFLYETNSTIDFSALK